MTYDFNPFLIGNLDKSGSAGATAWDDITGKPEGGIGFALERSSGLQVDDSGKTSIPFSGTITGWNVQTKDGTSGTITLSVKKAAYSGVPSFSAIDGGGAQRILLSSQNKNQHSSISAWTTAITAGDQFEISVASVTGTVTGVYGIITLTK